SVPLDRLTGRAVATGCVDNLQGCFDHVTAVKLRSAIFGVCPPSAQIFSSKFRVCFEATSCHNYRFGIQTTLFTIMLRNHADNFFIFHNQFTDAMTIPDVSPMLFSDSRMVLDKALTAINITYVQTSPEQIRAIWIFISLAFIHKAIFQSESGEPLHRGTRFVNQYGCKMWVSLTQGYLF